MGLSTTQQLRTTLAVVTAVATLAPATAAASSKPYDLNADGRQDLVVGLPWYADGDTRSAGAVVVADGSRRTLFGDVRLLDRSAFGAGDAADHFAQLGTGVASADFDGDGRSDLAAGEPGAGDHGAVRVRYGSGRTQTIAGKATDQRYSAFGSALVADDLDGDGYADLVVADTAADARQENDWGAGALYVIQGSQAGLADDAHVRIDRPRASYAGFGSSLAVGDADGDGHTDLFEAAQGQPEWSDDPPVSGHLTIVRNAGDGPTTAARVRGAMTGGPVSLAVGDVNGDGYADLVAGVPVDEFSGEDEQVPAGAVHVYRGGRDGVRRTPVVITQATRGVPGSSEEADRFGSAVAVSRIDGDRYADIVVGAPGEDEGRGRVTVIRGGPGSRARARDGHFAFDQDTKGVPGRSRAYRRFGATVALIDLTGDGRRDLVVGASGLEAATVTAMRGVEAGFRYADARVLRASRYAKAPLDDYVPYTLRLGREDGS